VAGYLKRLISSLAAYQLADLVSKFMGVLLLPVYTRYITPSGYGTVETLSASVIFGSIVVRFGIIEAFLRFHFSDLDQARRDALARRAVMFLLIATTVASIPLLFLARPISKLLLSRHDTGAVLIAVLGLWSFTNLELAYGLLRVEERLRAYAIASLTNVALTIAGSLILVVGFGKGAHGLLLANYGATVVVLLGVWWSMRHRLLVPQGVAERLSVLLRFGLPTVPAEASVYALSVIDRIYLAHARSLKEVGPYSIALKFAGAVAFVVRAWQYAWPPLAYSVTDDTEASRLYGLITTYYVLIAGWLVAMLALLGRWLLRLLVANSRGHQYYAAHRALTWVALGWALYGLWVVFLVIAGRAKVTTRNFAASLVGLATNVVLLILLVGPLGIAGAGLALCGAYVAMLAAMYLLTRSLFRVEFEWRRLLQLVIVFGGLATAGELALPTHGAVGLLSRTAVVLAMPAVLYAIGFPHPQEREQARAMVRRARGVGA
jgi:O-antigen/teichoic acid export membrane protein